MAAAIACAGAASAQERQFNIPAQPLAAALNQFGAQSDTAVLVRPDLADAKVTQGVTGAADVEDALKSLLAGTGLAYRRDGDTFLIVQGGSAGPQGAGAGDVDALIVTAQKREENIQDVPIAISAFSQEDLTRSQVAGGPDLMTQVPNFTFTKTNFSGYSIQIRGIGTQAISATTDAAVAVAFNNTPFIRNRFFEQEFYDLERVEVLRGPQGTLYGRNATAGVVNIISAKPKFDYEAKASIDVAKFNSTRLEGMVNVPLVEDKVALRLAGAWTKRDGYVTNEITDNPIDGRDLWSTRLSLRFAPTDAIDVNLIWEHFQENDDRLRSGKQLCKTHEVTEAAGFATTHFQTLPEFGQSLLFSGVQGSFSQGCEPASLYSPDSFQTPNGISLPYYLPLGAIFLPTAVDDPYVSRTQSHDLRVIESTVDPKYSAKNDLAEIQASFDLTDELTLTSETAYSADVVFSLEDFNRFATASGAWKQSTWDQSIVHRDGVLTDGVFCDPQIGCADRLVAVDVSTAKSRHFSQEFRLSSNYDGNFNFSLGVNFLRYDTNEKYYVFINSLSFIAAVSPYANRGDFSPYVAGVTDNRGCLATGREPGDPSGAYGVGKCTFMDTNPIGSLNDQGHNYFLSTNPYKLISYAAFGEAYYNVTENLKVTAGLRWTVDKKEAPRIPSWLLASNSAGYPVAQTIEQEWKKPTGRLTIDWKPDLSFTDQTLVYASFARGYKAGGANPPPYVEASYGSEEVVQAFNDKSATRPKTFDPEYVNAFEVGTKNTLLDGAVTLNLAAFYYDYTGYQISEIVDRSAFNRNFDATVWGLEIEADWRPVENLRLGFKGGYENTRLADGMRAIDLMDRTAGDPNWVVVRPFPTYAANCVLPAWLFVGNSSSNPQLVNVGGKGGGNPGGCEYAYLVNRDPATGEAYVFNPYAPPGQQGFSESFRSDIDYAAWSTNRADYPCLPAQVTTIGVMDYPGVDPQCLAAMSNGGEGLFKDISGNQLPNAPKFTATITADYSVPLPNDWLATLHTDLYYQSEAWTRVFNTEGYDKLKAYSNINLAAIFTNDEAGWTVMAYIKNVMDRDSITGAFLNSDDTGLTTNVFLTEPRLYGVRVTKEFTGGPWWTGGSDHPDGAPYPLTIEIGGQVQRHDAPYETLDPSVADAFSAGLDPTGVQHRDLDWGDGRDVKLTYRPDGSPWTISAGVRFGKTNSQIARSHREEAASDTAYCFTPPGYYFDLFCDPNSPYYSRDWFYIGTNWSDSSARSREEYKTVDFAVGRDVGLGRIGAGRSTLGLGMRYGQFKSTTSAELDGIPDWDLSGGSYKYAESHYRAAKVQADRKFEGVGPVASWDGSMPLLGDEAVGHLDLDWSVAGGVLFGKQSTSITGYEGIFPFVGNYGVFPYARPLIRTPIDIPRSKSTTVPLLDLSVGVSYQLQRIKLSTGYRWERYFDVLDAGYAERKSFDRTIDGPYFKLAIGFGG